MAEAFNDLILPAAKAERYAAVAEEIAAILDETLDDHATTVQKFLDRLEEIHRKSGDKRHMLKLRRGPKQRRAAKNLKAQV